MISSLIGSIAGMIGSFIKKKQLVGLYSSEQIEILRDLENHYMREEIVREEMGLVRPSGSSSSWSPQAVTSGSSSSWSPQAVTAKIGINKLGTPYFESLERRLDIEEEEYFKKEEFDL